MAVHSAGAAPSSQAAPVRYAKRMPAGAATDRPAESTRETCTGRYRTSKPDVLVRVAAPPAPSTAAISKPIRPVVMVGTSARAVADQRAWVPPFGVVSTMTASRTRTPST